MEWITIDRPGYFGEKRNELCSQFDKNYGLGSWRIAWQWGFQTIERTEALQIYEDAYYEHFKRHYDILTWLISNFSDVYDTSPSNVNAGFSYDIQETPNNHLHDVAIRRSVLRRGVWFSGKELLEVRSTSGKGWILSPCNILFHLPHMIYPGETKYKGQPRDFSKNPPWWITKGVPCSAEMFYQQNKILQTKKEPLII
jgi:hypothetical protein